MDNRDKQKLMIDRYGNPLGTPPEIYKEKVDYKSTKNDIDHGNDFNNNNNQYYNYNEFDNKKFENEQEYQKDKNKYVQLPIGDNYEFPERNEQLDLNHNQQYFNYNKNDASYAEPKYFGGYDPHFSYEPGTEQPLYVNVKQYNCIRKRKMRRDFLDTLMLHANQAGYLHESRHKHAMNRLRAPSGRFLTKEETEELRRKQNEEKNSSNSQ
ncbi:Transcriptional activator [Conglomerata obtusa]